MLINNAFLTYTLFFQSFINPHSQHITHIHLSHANITPYQKKRNPAPSTYNDNAGSLKNQDVIFHFLNSQSKTLEYAKVFSSIKVKN